MKELSIREARAGLTKIDEVLKKAGVVFVTRRKKRIAKVLPVKPYRTPPSRRALRESMPPMPQSSQDLIRADRDGR